MYQNVITGSYNERVNTEKKLNGHICNALELDAFEKEKYQMQAIDCQRIQYTRELYQRTINHTFSQICVPININTRAEQ